MLISAEAKSTMRLFTSFQRIGLLSKSEEFDRFYVWMNEVEQYAKRYNKR